MFENAFYVPAEREFHWERAIYISEADRDSPRNAPDLWHERDSLCLVLRDSDGEMIGYLSPDGPADGRIPTRETLRALQLFVNLMGLALANAQAHRAEVERSRLLEANQARLRHEATHDALTGLPNRTFFQERLAATLEQARARPDRTYAVLFVDLDEFKSINDSLGHLAGDALLIAVADRMRATTAAEDFIARIGGDEFALLLAHRHGVGEVEDAVEAIQDALVAPMLIESRAVYNTASIGIAIIDPHEERIQEVLRNADTAMYHAKSLGRGRHAFFDHHMHFEATRRLALTSDLRAAIEGEQFSVDYQPIVRLRDGRVQGFEALVRWRNPATGEVLPGEFIPLAEEVGLVVPIGRFVFVDACRRLAEWRGRAPQLNLRMHVNLSVQEVLEPDLDAFVARNLRRFGLSSDDIVLEITESAVIRSNTLSLGSLARLRATGVHLCIDDFGTGYSSLRYLHQLPVRRAQDRPLVRRERRRQPGQPADRADADPARALLRHRRRRRGRRDGPPGRGADGAGLPARPGLPLPPPAARRSRRRAARRDASRPGLSPPWGSAGRRASSRRDRRSGWRACARRRESSRRSRPARSRRGRRTARRHRRSRRACPGRTGQPVAGHREQFDALPRHRR